jgi:nucleotide-binding universal stress UspA family protein
MFKPKQIIVPTDFSECSERALMQAVELAEQFDSKIHIVHVSTKDVDHMPMFFLDDDKLAEITKHMNEHNKNEINKLIDKHIAPKNIPYEIHTPEGVPYDEIIKIAERLKVDLIVISSKGKNALEGFIFGSTTEKVVRKATCSVFVSRKQ